MPLKITENRLGKPEDNCFFCVRPVFIDKSSRSFPVRNLKKRVLNRRFLISVDAFIQAHQDVFEESCWTSTRPTIHCTAIGKQAARKTETPQKRCRAACTMYWTHEFLGIGLN